MVYQNPQGPTAFENRWAPRSAQQWVAIQNGTTSINASVTGEAIYTPPAAIAGAPGSSAQANISELGRAATVASIGGAVMSMVGNYYAIQNQKDQLKSQALSMRFAAQVAEFNKNMIEQAAGRLGETMKWQIGMTRMRAGEEKATARANAAGRGVKVDSGSAAELERAVELMSQIDAMTIGENYQDRITQLERGATNQGNQALIQGVSASNIMRSAQSLSPAAGFLATGIGSAGKVAGMFYDRFGRDGRIS